MIRSANEDQEAHALEKIDALVAAVVKRLAPIRATIAQTDTEREACFRLRYRVVIERGWLKPADLPDGLERDEYDERAVHILAWDDDTAIGTSRLVFPEPERKLPIEETFDLIVAPQGKVVDAGRFAVTRAHSSIEHRVLAVLIGRAWLELRARGYSHVCAAFASGPMIRVYRHMGLNSTILAAPRHYWGTERYPIRFDVAQSLPMLAERWLDKNQQGAD